MPDEGIIYTYDEIPVSNSTVRLIAADLGITEAEARAEITKEPTAAEREADKLIEGLIFGVPDAR